MRRLLGALFAAAAITSLACTTAVTPPVPAASPISEPAPARPFEIGEEALPELAVRRFGSAAFRHGGSIHDVVFSGDGQSIATGASDGTARVWALSGRRLAGTSFRAGSIANVGLSFDGRWLAAAADGELRVIEVASGRTVATPGDDVRVGALRFSPDGSKLAASLPGRILVWSTATWQVVREVELPAAVTSNLLLFTDDVHLLAARPGAGEKEYNLFNVLDGTSVVDAHPSVVAIRGPGAFDPAHLRMALCAPDQTIVLRSVATGEDQLTLPAPTDIPASGDTTPPDFEESPCSAIALSPDGRFLITSAPDAGVLKRPLDGGAPLRLAEPGYAEPIAISPDSSLVAVATPESPLDLYRVSDGQRRPRSGHRRPIVQAAVRQDGKRLLTVDWIGDVILWSADSGAELGRWKVEGFVESLTFDPAGADVLVGTTSGVARHDATTGEKRAPVFPAPNAPVPPGAPVPSSTPVPPVAAAATSTGARVDRPSTLELAAPPGKRRDRWDLGEPIRHVVQSPDGARLFVAFERGGVEILDPVTRRTVEDVAPTIDPPTSTLALSPNGSLLVLGGSDGVLSIHRTAGGRLVRRLTGHDGRVSWIGFSVSGDTMYSAGSDGLAYAWDLRSFPETALPAPPLPGVPAVDPALRRRLETEPLSGLVRARARVLLFATAESARAHRETEAPMFDDDISPALTVVSDEGDVVRVRTAVPKTSGLNSVDPDYAIEAYVRRVDLAPLLRTAKRREAPDGTGFSLREGLLLDIVGGVRPLSNGLGTIPAGLTGADVSLSFQPTATFRKLAPPGKPHDCGKAPCHFVQPGTSRRAPVLAPLQIEGQPAGAPHSHFHDACDTGVDVRASRDGATLLLTRTGARAEVRFAVDRSVLTTRSPCGTIGGTLGGLGLGGGRAGRTSVTVWRVVGRVPAVFPDGSKAGHHVGKTTELRKPTLAGDLVCSKRPAFAEPICHKRALLRETVEER